MSRNTRHVEPLDLGLDHDTVDLTAVANTQYASGFIDIRQYFIFTAIIDVLETGSPNAGAFKLTLQVLAKDKSTVLWQQDILTAIDSQTNASRTVLLFGAGASAAVSGSGTLGADADLFKVGEYIKLVIEVTTANDGTTSTAQLNLLMEG